MEVRCPHCYETLSSDAMGQVVGCPHCQNPFMMPEDDLPVAGPLSVQAPTETAVVPEQQPQQPAPNPAENIVITTHPRVEPRPVAIYKGMRNTLLFIVGLLSVLVVLSYAYPDLLRFQKQHRSPKEAVREGSHSTDSPKPEKISVQPPKPGRSPEELVRVALESTDPAQQEKAIAELAEFGKPGLKYLARVLAESPSDRVRAAIVHRLASESDYGSMPLLLDALADPLPEVRECAGTTVRQLLGTESRFDAHAPPEERERAIAALRKEWKRLRDSPAFESRQRHRSPEELVQIALESADPVERQKAAAELTELGRPALKHLRRLVTEGQSDGARAVAIQGLAFQRDYECMPALLDAMEDPSLVVRGRAGAAVQRLLGLDFDFDADAPLEKRERLIAAMRKQWENLRDSPGFKVRRKEMQSQ